MGRGGLNTLKLSDSIILHTHVSPRLNPRPLHSLRTSSASGCSMESKLLQGMLGELVRPASVDAPWLWLVTTASTVGQREEEEEEEEAEAQGGRLLSEQKVILADPVVFLSSE